jgi:hypothetical protein
MRLKDHLDRSLFGDVNFEQLDVDKFPKSIIQRVVYRGTELQKEKLIEYYGFDFVRETMLKARYIFPLGIQFVLVRLDIPLIKLRLYQESKLTGGNFLYKENDFHIDEYLCF